MTIWGQDISYVVLFSAGMFLGFAFGWKTVFQDLMVGGIVRRDGLKVGDIIELRGNVAWVDRIGLRSLVLRMRDHSQCVLSYRELCSCFISRPKFVRRELVIKIPIDSNPRCMEEHDGTTASIISTVGRIMMRPPALGVVETTYHHAVMLRTCVWMYDCEESFDNVRNELLYEVWLRMVEAGCALPISTPMKLMIH